MGIPEKTGKSCEMPRQYGVAGCRLAFCCTAKLIAAQGYQPILYNACRVTVVVVLGMQLVVMAPNIEHIIQDVPFGLIKTTNNHMPVWDRIRIYL